MRELTIHELDAELAEQLPARELMNCYRSRQSSSVDQSNYASQGNTYQSNGLIGANVNVSDNQVNLLSFGNSNGGIFQSNSA